MKPMVSFSKSKMGIAIKNEKERPSPRVGLQNQGSVGPSVVPDSSMGSAGFEPATFAV